MAKKVTFEAGSKGSRLRSGELAGIVGCTRKRICELAVDRQIPGAKRTKGGHWYFVRCPALDRWISERRMGVDLRAAKNGIKLPRNRRARSWPVPVQCLCKFTSAVDLLGKHPHTRWKPEQVEHLKSLLLPVTRALWPDGPPRRDKESS